jgi:Mg2+ and Co2+ transporter CorA
MANLDDTLAVLKEINARLTEISDSLSAKDRKSEESLNTIRKDLWNIKNVVADENIQKRIIQKGVEQALSKAAMYLIVSGLMLYIVGKFLL